MSRFEIPHGRGLVRFLHFINYPTGMSLEDGDKWYFSKHVPQAKNLNGVVRYKTWKALPPIKMWTYDPYERFARVSELAFESMDACLKATTRNPELWALTSGDKPGFRELDLNTFSKEGQVRPPARKTANSIHTDSIHSKLFDCAGDRSGESGAPCYG